MTRRILGTVIAFTAIAVAVFFVPAALSIHSAQQRGDLLALQREASVIAQRLPSNGSIDADTIAPAIDSDHRVALYGAGGQRLLGDGPATGDRPVVLALAGEFTEGHVGDDLVAAVPAARLGDGSLLVVRVEEPGSVSRHRYWLSMIELGLAALVIIAAAALAARLVARRLNRPIEALREWAAQPDGTAEAPPPAKIEELEALRAELISDRERIRDLLSRERSFSSQVSHQLRTPVAALRVAVETELDAPRDDPTALLHEALGEIDRLESTILSLLALARHDRRPSERVDLAAAVSRAAESVRSRLPADRTLSVDGGPVDLVTDRAAVEHVVDVLLENALRHGRGAIVATVARRDGDAVVEVTDEGARPTDRDVFADVGSDTGHGIGLRLARSLAESVGGTLVLTDDPATTFRFTVPGPGG